MLVLEIDRDHARRGRGHEHIGRLDLPCRRLQVLDVFFQGRVTLEGDRPGAGRGHRVQPFERAPGEFRHLVEIPYRQTSACSFKSGKPLAHIGRVTNLARFAVVDDVEAGLGLLADHVVDGLADLLGQRSRLPRR